MENLLQIWSSYQICYAIGYMLLVRPIIYKATDKTSWVLKKGIDYLFFVSLLIFSTIKLFNS